MKRLFAVAIIALSWISSASAQQFNWTGLYFGGNAGFVWGNGSNSVFENDTPATWTFDHNLDAFFAGIQGGYNFQAPGSIYVWGWEIDIQWGDANDRRTAALANGTGIFTGSFDRYSTLRLRTGVTNGPALWYVTAGAAWPGARFTGFTPFDASSGYVSGSPKMGYAVGTGLEWLVGNNWTVKVEYLYLDFGSKTVTAVGTGGETIIGNFDLNAHTIRFGFNYLFNTGARP